MNDDDIETRINDLIARAGKVKGIADRLAEMRNAKAIMNTDFSKLSVGCKTWNTNKSLFCDDGTLREVIRTGINVMCSRLELELMDLVNVPDSEAVG